MNRTGVLLLGGGGFICNALMQRMAHDGIPHAVMHRQENGRLKRELARCHTVFHLASTTTPGTSAAKPSLELENMSLSLHLLDELENKPDVQLVYFSSGGTVYGESNQLPMAVESSHISPISYYGAGKLAQESFFNVLRRHGHAITMVRPSNVYGPGQRFRQGFGIVRSMLECARSGRQFEIWGDGENVRDYIYIDDIVEACMGLLRFPNHSGTYNLGSGFGYSVNQVKSIVEMTTGKNLNTIYHLPRRGDVRNVVLDSAPLWNLLSRRPATGFEDGIKYTWEWLKST